MIRSFNNWGWVSAENVMLTKGVFIFELKCTVNEFQALYIFLNTLIYEWINKFKITTISLKQPHTTFSMLENCITFKFQAESS